MCIGAGGWVLVWEMIINKRGERCCVVNWSFDVLKIHTQLLCLKAQLGFQSVLELTFFLKKKKNIVLPQSFQLLFYSFHFFPFSISLALQSNVTPGHRLPLPPTAALNNAAVLQTEPVFSRGTSRIN